MSDAPGGEKSALDKCITAANMIVQRKIFSDATKKNKDEASLILFGTDGTSNPLNEGGSGYDHVTIAKEMAVMDLELLNFIKNKIPHGTAQGDFVDALVVAVDHLRSKCLGRKMEQKIILFSDMCSNFEADQLEHIITAMKNNEVNLIFVGPETDDDDDDGNDKTDQPGPSNREAINHPRGKPLSKQQIAGIQCIRHVLDEVDGEGMSISEVLPMLSFFEKRRRKQTTAFRGPIEIGSLKINVYAYVKISEEKPASWKKLSALAETAASRDTMKVEMQRSFHHKDEDETEVDQENTAQAYRYGKTLVPMTPDDQKTMKLQTTKGCQVLGFTSHDNIDRSQFSRNGCHIFVANPDDQHAAVAFSALCHALLEKNMVAIVRYISRGGFDPKLGFLSPHIKSSYESLIFIALPYREDLRQYWFSPLEGGKVKESTQEQNQIMDDFIDAMSLVQNVVVDGEEEVIESFKPKDILNPITQRQCQCVQSRALNPDETRIPEIEEYIARSIQVIPEKAANCRANVNKLKESFPLEEVEKKKTKSSNIFNTHASNDEPEQKKSKIEDETFSFASLSRNQITEVGTVNPIHDFQILIENASDEKLNKVREQMADRILRLVNDSFLNHYYEKALKCLKVLKEHCVSFKVSAPFNELLLKLKETTMGTRKDGFWLMLVKDNIGPISQKVSEDSTYSETAANAFFAKTEDVTEEAPVQQTEEDEDDLLDQM